MRYEDWRQLHLDLVWCYEGIPGGAGKSSYSNERNLCAWLIRQGSAEVVKEGHVFKAGPGQWLFPRPGERTQTFSLDIRILSIGFHANWPAGEPFFDEGLNLVVEGQEVPDLEAKSLELQRRIEKHVPEHDYFFMRKAMSLRAFTEIQSFLPTWFFEYSETVMSRGAIPVRRSYIDPRLIEALRIVESSDIREPLKASLVARQVGLSAVQLERLFVRLFGHTVKAHVERRRIDHAVAALSMASARVKEVGLELGFSDLSHFTRWFRRHKGISPREYRYAKDVKQEIYTGK